MGLVDAAGVRGGSEVGNDLGVIKANLQKATSDLYSYDLKSEVNRFRCRVTHEDGEKGGGLKLLPSTPEVGLQDGATVDS